MDHTCKHIFTFFTNHFIAVRITNMAMLGKPDITSNHVPNGVKPAIEC